MKIKKSFLTVALASGLSIIGSSVLTTTNVLGKNTNILPTLNSRLNDGTFYVGSVEDIIKMNEAIAKGRSVRRIALIDDIDLAGLSASEVASQFYPYSGDVGEIDGNGYSIKNKSKELLFLPLIDDVSASTSSGALYIHNLVLDNAPLMFEYIYTAAYRDSVSSSTGSGITGDRILDDSRANSTNSLYFQNISIINTNVENETFALDDGTDYNISNSGYLGINNSPNEYNFGLLSNGVLLLESGNQFDDNVIKFNGLKLANNKINNNTFSFSTPIEVINFGIVSNFRYEVCGTSSHQHIGVISFDNVLIENNEFVGNEIVGASDDVVFSFSPLISSFVFDGVNWTGSGGNFLKLNSILIQNNTIEKPDGVAKENFKYSDLVSQSLSLEEASSLFTDVELFQEVISLNNDIYIDSDAEEYYKDPVVVSIENVGTNTWTQEGSDKLFFVGNSYSNDENLNLFVNESGSESFNNIFHSETLGYKDDASVWNDMSLMLQRKFGIYGVSMTQDLNGNLDKIEISSPYTDALEDKVEILNVTVDQDEFQSITSLAINFNLLLSSDNNIDETGEFIKDPVTISNVKLINEGDVLLSSDDTYNALSPADLNYSFEVIFNLDRPLDNFDPTDYPTLQMQFDYTNGVTKFVRTTTVDIDPQDLLDKWNFVDNQLTDPGLKISAGVLGGVVGLILLILLIIILLLLYRRRKIAKVTEVQDGYYEFEDDGAGFDDGSQSQYDYDGYANDSYDEGYDNSHDNYEDSYDEGYDNSYDNYEDSYDEGYDNSYYDENSYEN